MPPKAKATLLHEELTALKAQRAALKKEAAEKTKATKKLQQRSKRLLKARQRLLFHLQRKPNGQRSCAKLVPWLFFVAGAALWARYRCFSWQVQHFEHVMILFRGRCSTLTALWFFFVAGAALWARYAFFFVAGAAFEHVMLFFSWQAQHFEHVMVQNWALVVARCSIVTWCSRKKNYIYFL